MTTKIKGEKLLLQKSYPYRFGIINDIHVGGQYALWPLIHKTRRGKGYGITANGGQEILWDYWMSFADECAKNKVNVLLIVGDLVTGQNRKELGSFTMTTSLEEQKDACATVLAEFIKKIPSLEKIYLFKGTPYHASRDTSVEKSIGENLKEQYDIDVEFRSEYALFDLIYGDRVKKLFVTHPASNAQMYPEQAMGKDMLVWLEKVALGQIQPVDMIIRAHKHNFLEVHKRGIRALQLPCWQFFVPYDQAMKNYARWQPDIGGVILLFDDHLRTTVWHFLYDNVQEPAKFLTLETPYEVEKINLKPKDNFRPDMSKIQ